MFAVSKVPPTRKPRTSRDGRPIAYHPCISCYKGDTDTVMVARGEAEFHMAVLATFAGLPENEARDTMVYYAHESLGCTPGNVPGGQFVTLHRLCAECAEKTGALISTVADVKNHTSVPAYLQPEEATVADMTPADRRKFFQDINAYLRTVDPDE